MPTARAGTPRRMTDTDNGLDLSGLNREEKLHLIATVILLEEGGPLAEELLAMPADEDAPDHQILDDLRRREDFLRSTLAWTLAERKLAGRR
jgi:hypothetical protein